MPIAQLDKLMRFVKNEIFPHVKYIPQDQSKNCSALTRCYNHIQIEEGDIRRVCYEDQMKIKIFQALSHLRKYVVKRMRKVVIGKWLFHLLYCCRNYFLTNQCTAF